jgi:protease I
MEQQKILIITGDAGESYETLYAIHRFMEADFTPVVASNKVKALNLVIHEMEPGWDTYRESPGYRVSSDIVFADVIVEDYVAVLLIGGRAPEFLRHDPQVIKIVRDFDSAGKFVFAICHGIQILTVAGLVKDKNVTCYEHVHSEAVAYGGKYSNKTEAVRDGKLVTGQTWQSHPEFYKLVFQCLTGN